MIKTGQSDQAEVSNVPCYYVDDLSAYFIINNLVPVRPFSRHNINI